MGDRQFFIQEIWRTSIECLSRMPNGQQRNVLPAAFHAAHMRTINAHAFSQCLLAEAGTEAVTAHVAAKHIANVHLQDGGRWCILLLRIKIRRSFNLKR